MITKEQLQPYAKPVLLYGLLPLVIVAAIIMAGGVFYAQAYTNKIFPNISIGSVDVGGLTTKEASTKLASTISTLLQTGVNVTTDHETKTLPLVLTGVEDPSSTIDLVHWNTDALVSQAYAIGREGTRAGQIIRPLLLSMQKTTLPAEAVVDTDLLTTELQHQFPDLFKNPPTDATFTFTQTTDGWTAEIVEEQPGVQVDTEAVFQQIQDNMNAFRTQTVSLPSATVEPLVTTSVAKQYLQEALTAVSSAPYTLTYTKTVGDDQTWEIDAQTIANHLAILTTNTVPSLGFNTNFSEALQTVLAGIIVPAQDAKLTMENGIVKEFQGSQTGVSVDTDATTANLVAVLGQTNQTAPVIVVTTEPEVTIGDINELGIKEVLGIGVSKFKGSPTNRIKNIQNGARLLNGTLIEPGEEFSLLNKLGPFTEGNGYLPELVIKGDQIKPEIGGGLCQIGTTTFRAAMNSGLPITARSNHSLVVSYYNDLSNGNPGTDATIYDPAPDFKFVNDTGHTILFVANMDLATSTLTFTFWGTSDGRKGSYSPPVVERWIPAGEKRITETVDLAPGKTSCQSVHPGADTSFTYTITHPDGTQTDRIFTSHYRALPEICLVGVEQLSEEPETDDPSTESPTDTPIEKPVTEEPTSNQGFPTRDP